MTYPNTHLSHSTTLDSDIVFVKVENKTDKTMTIEKPIKLEKENNAFGRSKAQKRDLLDEDSSDEDESSSSVPSSRSSRKRQQDSINYNEDEDDDKIEKILREDNNAFWEEKRNENKKNSTGTNTKRKVIQSCLKVPAEFINVDEKEQVNGGETFMLAVLKKAETIGFSETFAYGKWKKFQNQILEEEFAPGGIFEE